MISGDTSIQQRRKQIKRAGIALAAYSPPFDTFAIQLQSIREQTFRNWTCWITLDSPLGPLKDVPELRPFFEDSRFIWSENPVRLGHKRNFERAMNLCAQDATIEAIACSDQDDRWYPEKLERSLQLLERKGPNALVHCDMHVLNADGSLAPRTGWALEERGVHHATVEALLIRNVVAGCAMVLDAGLVRDFPVIPDAFEYHDHWYAVVAAAHGGCHPLPEPLYAYRQHGGNVVGVSEFRGTWAIPVGQRSPLTILAKLLGVARRSELLAASLPGDVLRERAGLHLLPRPTRIFGYLRLARAVHSTDHPLARAAIARALGCLLLPLRLSESAEIREGARR